jgi:hypothetical protein
MIAPPDWLERISVTDHALLQAVDRLGPVDRGEIRSEIRVAILQGRVSSTKPDWVVGRDPCDPCHWHVWNERGDRCWIIARSDGYGLVAKTVLLDRDGWAALGERRKLRNGTQRL